MCHVAKNNRFHLSWMCSTISVEIGNPSGVVVNVLDYDIVISEFELQSRYNVHF